MIGLSCFLLSSLMRLQMYAHLDSRDPVLEKLCTGENPLFADMIKPAAQLARRSFDLAS